jgi:hypothetical protein
MRIGLDCCCDAVCSDDQVRGKLVANLMLGGCAVLLNSAQAVLPVMWHDRPLGHSRP